MAIQQADIIDGNIVFTNLDPYKINPGSELEGNTSANTYSIGSSGTIPLQIKMNGSSNTGWTDEQDIVIYGVSITTSTPIVLVGSTVSITTGTIAITTGTLIGLYGAGAWAATGTMTQSRYASGSAGTKNSGLMAGGFAGGGSTALSTSELFNGSTWVASGAMTQSRGDMNGGLGSQNAALIIGGDDGSIVLSSTEFFNGSTWSQSGVMTQSRSAAGCAGSQNASLVSGSSSGTVLSNTETFNGANWAQSGVMTQSRGGAAGAGTKNAALVAGGSGTNALSSSELFNGSTWSQSGLMTQSRNLVAGAGSQNAALVTGGLGASSLSSSELFNGSTWTASGAMTQSRQSTAGGGSQNAALVAGGLGTGTTGLSTAEIHSQSLYRPMTWDNLRCASNIGVATNISGNTANVKLQGFVQNMSISSTAGNYLVVTRNTSTTTSTATFQAFKTIPDAEDWIVGVVQTVTTNLLVSNNPILTYDELKNWG